jgi:hypothetical protein
MIMQYSRSCLMKRLTNDGRVGVSMILVESCCLGGASYKASLGGLRRIEQGLALPLMIHA